MSVAPCPLANRQVFGRFEDVTPIVRIGHQVNGTVPMFPNGAVQDVFLHSGLARYTLPFRRTVEMRSNTVTGAPIEVRSWVLAVADTSWHFHYALVLVVAQRNDHMHNTRWLAVGDDRLEEEQAGEEECAHCQCNVDLDGT